MVKHAHVFSICQTPWMLRFLTIYVVSCNKQHILKENLFKNLSPIKLLLNYVYVYKEFTTDKKNLEHYNIVFR